MSKEEKSLGPFGRSPFSGRVLEQVVTKRSDAQIAVLYVIEPMLGVYEVEAQVLPAARTRIE